MARHTLLLGALLALCGLCLASGLDCAVEQRRDCGFVGIDAGQCGARGCCWEPKDNAPWCFYPVTETPKYVVSRVSKSANGFSAQLLLSNPGSGSYGPALKELLLTAVFESDARAHFRLTDPTRRRYEVPEFVLPFPKIPAPGEPGAWSYENSLYSVHVAQQGEALSLRVVRTVDSTVIFDLADLEYSDQFLQLGNRLPAGEPYLYGLGQHVMNLRLPTDDHSFTMWNADVPTPWDQNEYGSHPYYMQVLEGSGLAHAVFLRNSNGMDVITSRQQVTFKAIGGILDWYVFAGPTPEVVTQQYHALIGLPHMPPYWSMGWHQCKYGWVDVHEVRKVVADYEKNQIPLDTVWADIDYMHYWENFSWNATHFSKEDSRAFAEELHASGRKYVPIIDPGIHNRTGYPAYDEGLKDDVFIKTGDGKGVYIGEVWPGSTAFPDWFAPNAEKWWGGQIREFLAAVPYDGIWIDMNEASSFINGEVSDPVLPVNNPPYHINNYNQRLPLNHRALPVDALHYGGLREYDVHNLYGAAEAVHTKKVLEEIQQRRSFILSRSTFPGSGAHVAMWLGDNYATWDDLYRSIPGILSMNMFGIPMSGADVCGFLGKTNEELCARWTALGAFYPFTRNHHHGPPGDDQEPYRWESVASVARKVLAKRYELLPTLYSLYWRAHTQGGTVARPLFFNYPQDQTTYDIDHQFMWGDALLITPVLAQGADSVTGYFPPRSLWFDLWDLSPQAGGWQTLPCSLADGVRVHIAGGSVLTMQRAALTTVAARKTEFSLLVALNGAGEASGEFFWDDGENLLDWADSLTVAYAVTARSLVSTVTHNTFTATDSLPPLSTVTVANFASKPQSVSLDGHGLPWSWDAHRRVLSVSLRTAGVKLSRSFEIEWKLQPTERIASE